MIPDAQKEHHMRMVSAAQILMMDTIKGWRVLKSENDEREDYFRTDLFVDTGSLNFMPVASVITSKSGRFENWVTALHKQ